MCLRRRLQANVVTPSLFRMLMLMFCVFPYCFLPFSAFTAIFGVVVLDSAGERCSFVGESCFVPSFGICVPY